MTYGDSMPTRGDADRQGGPVISADAVRLQIPSHVAELDGVALEVDFSLGIDQEFRSDGRGGWVLDIPRPAAHRFEYKLKMRSGDNETIEPDPTNPRQVPGPFGAKSEIRFPDYLEPEWLATDPAGSTVGVPDPASDLDTEVPIQLFSPASLPSDEPAPLLLVHDGSDFADRGRLLSWATATKRRARIALLDPPHGYRNAWYAANPTYSDHIAGAVLPALKELVPVSSVVGLGASLGALAWFTVHHRWPRALDGLALQSGSFFRHETDGQESKWLEFQQVCAAVESMTSAPGIAVRPVPVFMTVGALEENRANNERMAGALVFQGYPLDAHLVPDAHNLIGWRDAWSSGLDRLMERVP